MGLSQKIPFAASLSNAIQTKIDENEQSSGQCYPCHVTEVNGSIVTINFEVIVPDGITLPPVTCPIAESQYVRLPVQVGDKGIAIAANTRLGGISNLGLGYAPLINPSNLGGLVFMPIGDKKWFTVDGTYLFMYGINGVELTTINQDCKLTLTSTGITINLNGGNLTINNGNTIMNGNLTVNGNISNTGTLQNNGKDVGSTHKHSGVQSGTSNTGNPI
jgi:hypothetical protein